MKLKIIIVVILVILLGSSIYLFAMQNKQKSANEVLIGELSKTQIDLAKANKEMADAKASYQAQLDSLQAKLDSSAGEKANTTSAGNKFANAVVSKNASDYKTVKMTNGQIYYGVMSSYSGGVVTLGDIYYLQGNQSNTPQQQISLVKKGAELDGTPGPMMINDSSIVSIETLGTDSQVFKAIAMDKSR